MFNFGDVDFFGVYFVFIHLELSLLFAPMAHDGEQTRIYCKNIVNEADQEGKAID